MAREHCGSRGAARRRDGKAVNYRSSFPPWKGSTSTSRSFSRIEATAKTPWFGFLDDVVVRVAPTAAGSRIDVRSVSRVGRGDFGTNARRIRAYLDKLAHA